MATSNLNNAAERVREHLEASAQLKLRCARELRGEISACASEIIKAFTAGGKLMVCGNGGSAADAQHLASELSGRFRADRQALPAIALTTDTSALTAISNDYGFDRVFERQVHAHARAGDVLVVISTSGKSRNILLAAQAGHNCGCHVIGLTGEAGVDLAAVSHRAILVPSRETALIQEAHESIIHCWGIIIEEHYLVEQAKADNP